MPTLLNYTLLGAVFVIMRKDSKCNYFVGPGSNKMYFDSIAWMIVANMLNFSV